MKILTVKYSGERPLNLSSMTCPGNDIVHWKNASLGRPERPLPLAVSTVGTPKCSDRRFIVAAVFHCRECRKQNQNKKSVGRQGQEEKGQSCVHSDTTVTTQLSPH